MCGIVGVALLQFTGHACAGCVDEDGNHVDWLVLYKLPRKSEFPPPAGKKDYIEDGQGYMYLTSKSPEHGWTESDKSIKDSLSIPGRILSPVYEKSNNLLYMFYNDEHPDGNTSFTRGHTKGVVAFGPMSGFWLVHSVPKYPPAVELTYDYPHTGQMYGQSFLCVSLPTFSAADVIGLQLLYNEPYVYSHNVPEWAEKKYPHMAMAARGQHVKKAPFTHTGTLRSLAGHLFTSFAKFSKFGKDLYADFVAPALGTDLLVETWPNGPGKMNSSCKGTFKVLNVDKLDFRLKPEDVEFVTKKDHAKWAVSLTRAASSSSKKVLCIGDINRMNTQKKRAGGTVCFENDYAWKAFRSIIAAIEACH